MTESKSGRQAWKAPVFIDTTGDGDLSAQAGCEFEIGEAESCPCQPMSMCVLITVKDPAAISKLIHRTDPGVNANRSKMEFLAEIRRAGIDPSYGAPTLFPVRDSLLLAMGNHQYGVLATDAVAVTDATLQARAELHRNFRGLRKLGGVWERVDTLRNPCFLRPASRNSGRRRT